MENIKTAKESGQILITMKYQANITVKCIVVSVIILFSEITSQNILQYQNKALSFETSEILRVPYNDSSMLIPAPEFGPIISNNIIIYHYEKKENSLFVGVDQQKGRTIYKFNTEKGTLLERIKPSLKVLDFTLYNETVVVLNPSSFTYYDLQLDSISQQTFPQQYKLSDVIYKNYFLLDYMYARKCRRRNGSFAGFVYSLEKNEFRCINKKEEGFFPIVVCASCADSVLDRINKCRYASMLGQSNRYIIYFTKESNNNRAEIFIYDKATNIVHFGDNLTVDSFHLSAIRPLTAVNDNQFLFAALRNNDFDGVIFKLMTIHSNNK
ncbi:MAG: hypothetical protein ACLFQB_12460 [Chitinispirillaceae bacterium]